MTHPRQPECPACGRRLPPARHGRGDTLCRRCDAARSMSERLEELAWKNQAWSVFTRIETASLDV